MIEVSRSPDPDIPAKELFLQVVRTYIPTDKLERFRQSLAPELQGKNLVEFVGSPFFRSHLEEMQAMEGRPGMLPHLAHAAVLAERRRAEKVSADMTEIQDAVGSVLEEGMTA